ncbi:MAG: DNA-binding protein [Elusimicrobia bacterium HGW-Elusimicrobia-1]|nr:MAG: DNA-binding protein [Elusimicrobia bacterium HGW-Elusimicrobia-1]
MERKLLKVAEAAEYLGTTEGTLYVWVCRKRIPHIKMGRKLMFDVSDLEKWIASQKIPAES